MKTKLKSILSSIPRIFIIVPESDYSRFMVKGGAYRLMRDNWKRTGRHLHRAIEKVTQEIDEQQAH